MSEEINIASRLHLILEDELEKRTIELATIVNDKNNIEKYGLDLEKKIKELQIEFEINLKSNEEKMNGYLDVEKTFDEYKKVTKNKLKNIEMERQKLLAENQNIVTDIENNYKIINELNLQITNINNEKIILKEENECDKEKNKMLLLEATSQIDSLNKFQIEIFSLKQIITDKESNIIVVNDELKVLRDGIIVEKEVNVVLKAQNHEAEHELSSLGNELRLRNSELHKHVSER